MTRLTHLPDADTIARKLDWLERYRQAECARAYNAYVAKLTNPQGTLRSCA